MAAGEAVFFEVMKRDAVRRQSAIRSVVQQVPVTYMIFDILYLDGEWLTSLPLQKRQALLAEVTRPTDRIQLVQNFDDAEGLYNAVRQQGLEGIVVKDLASTYPLNGRDGRWRKKKVYRDVVAAVGGVTLRDGVVNALLLGLYDTEGRLWYVGHVGTGKLSHQDWLRLTEGIAPLRQMDMPFVVKPPRSAGAVWLKPTLAVKVQFADWTDGRTLRQPSIQAFVPMDVRECRFEESEAPESRRTVRDGPENNGAHFVNRLCLICESIRRWLVSLSQINIMVLVFALFQHGRRCDG
ncbi:hypothetical protein GCM10025857_25730 [Alicyclobacillus contaminans]|nr:hypothetical protein GCM10025857_25730 [Alicyclobacillus contaminans]